MEQKNTVIIESTATCGRLPVLVFAAEELGLSYSLCIRPDGYFETEFHTMGPAISISGEHVVGLDAALLLLAARDDRPAGEKEALRYWLAFHVDQLRPAVVGMRRQQPDARAALEQSIDTLNAHLSGSGAYLDGEFGLSDCLSISLLQLGRLGINLDGRPALRAYVERLATRDAWTRAQRRMQEGR